MNTSIWTADAVSNAILQGNANLEIVFANYLKCFIARLSEYDITLQELQSIDSLYERVIEGIDKLEKMRKEYLSVIDIFAASSHPLLERYLPVFFEQLLNFYEEQGITLYTGSGANVLRNDHYRFFNQSLFIALTAILVENQCFEALAAILQARFKVYYKSYRMIREVNFMRLREFNYTLNEYLNNSLPKRVSITAEYIFKYAEKPSFDKLIKADILLYYMSLWYHSDEVLDPYWFPELSVYNQDKEILPFLASKSYFDKAKVLFGVKTVEQYKKLLNETEDLLQRGGLYRVPTLKVGLLYNTVASKE